METIRKADVIIIGSGVIGNSTAYYLAKEGLKVIVLEKDNIIGNGASTRNGGMNKINGRGLGEIPLSIYGLDLWPKLNEEIDCEYRELGGIRIALNDEQYEYMSRFLKFGKEYGLHFEEMDGNELRRRRPAFSDKITAAIYTKEESKMNPLKTTLGLYSKAREMGVEYFTGEKVSYLEEKQGRIYAAVTECGHRFEADKIMVAAGYDSRAILDTVGIDIPLYSYYEEIFVTEKVPRILDEMFVSAKVTYYGEQQENGSILFGGASGFGNYPNREFYPDNYQEPKRLPAAARALADIFPCLADTKIIRGWSGWMDISPDDSMMIGELDIPGLYMACGFSGHGFGIAVPTGKVMSELIAEKPLGADIQYLKLDRFKNHMDMFTGEDRNFQINAIQKK